ncbi:hypothetical protein CEXT_139041, partial [Caerostris extrusa]
TEGNLRESPTGVPVTEILLSSYAEITGSGLV